MAERQRTILVVDDEAPQRQLLGGFLQSLGFRIREAASAEDALTALRQEVPDMLLLDVRLPGMSGIEALAEIRRIAADLPVLLITAFADLRQAVAAMKSGADDYLSKPIDLNELEVAVADALGTVEGGPRRPDKTALELPRGVVCERSAMCRVVETAAVVAPSNAPILILGESGAGKEIVAQLIHRWSSRAAGPFVAANCAGLPETLIESELFGHRKGAFTGADEHRVGLFEVAQGGSIFLDEIGELPKSMQAKLLRVLESGEIRRIGDNESRQIDVRVICATHRNLSEMVEDADFREDLMYRINTFEIHLPPLRLRIDDIPDLAEHLYRRFRPSARPNQEAFTPDAIRLLKSHSWPGNVRELANVIEHATILCDEPPISPEHMPRSFNARGVRMPDLGPVSLRDLEMHAILQSLDRHDGNKAVAAEELGVSLKTLYNKLNQAQDAEQRKSA
jgi:two-component system NtrC family response regulator